MSCKVEVQYEDDTTKTFEADTFDEAYAQYDAFDHSAYEQIHGNSKRTSVISTGVSVYRKESNEG
jgi:hypothetical protein